MTGTTTTDTTAIIITTTERRRGFPSNVYTCIIITLESIANGVSAFWSNSRAPTIDHTTKSKSRLLPRTKFVAAYAYDHSSSLDMSNKERRGEKEI